MVVIGWILVLLTLTTGSWAQEDSFKKISDDIARLSAKMSDLTNSMDYALVLERHFWWNVTDISLGIESVVGSGCKPWYQFQCGSPEPACIAEYLVCDGVPDCPNGRDEQGDICKLPFADNTHWEVHAMPFYNCLENDPRDEPMPGPESHFHLIVTEDDILPSRPQISGTWMARLFRAKLHWMWNNDGFYSYANRQFVIWWPAPMWNGHGFVNYNPRTQMITAPIIVQRRIGENIPWCGLYLWEPKSRSTEDHSTEEHHDYYSYGVL